MRSRSPARRSRVITALAVVGALVGSMAPAYAADTRSVDASAGDTRVDGAGQPLYLDARRPVQQRVEDLLRRVLSDGMDEGAFVVDDLRATTALVLACLQGRQVTHGEGPERDSAVAVTERFVLRAVGVRGA